MKDNKEDQTIAKNLKLWDADFIKANLVASLSS